MAGQHRSSTSTAVERGQQYCGGHGQEGPDWQRLLLPLSNLLVPCSQIDFGMNCCGRAQPEAAGHGAGWGGSRLGCAAAAGTDTAALSHSQAAQECGHPDGWSRGPCRTPPDWQDSKGRPGAPVVLGSCLRRCCGLGTELSWSS